MLWPTTLLEDSPVWGILHTEAEDAAEAKAARMVQSVLDLSAMVPQNNVVVLCVHESIQGEHEEGLECWCGTSLIVFGATPGFEEA